MLKAKTRSQEGDNADLHRSAQLTALHVDAGLETLVQMGKSRAKAAKATKATKATKVKVVQIQHETLWIPDFHGTSAQHLYDLQGSRKIVNKLPESDPTP